MFFGVFVGIEIFENDCCIFLSNSYKCFGICKVSIECVLFRVCQVWLVFESFVSKYCREICLRRAVGGLLSVSLIVSCKCMYCCIGCSGVFLLFSYSYRYKRCLILFL